MSVKERLCKRRSRQRGVMAFIKVMMFACFFLHGEIVLVIDVFVGAGVAEEYTSWCMFLIYFISLAVVLAYNELATKHAKVTKVGAATGVTFKWCHGAR